MNGLNYCTHAVDDLLAMARSSASTAPLTAHNVLRIAALLRHAVKFQLPDNGDLFEDGLRALPDTFRLPYPVTAAVFRIARDAPAAQQPMNGRGTELIKSTRRIALAVEITTENLDEFSWMLPHYRHDALTDGGAIAVIPVFFADADQRWAIPPLGVVIPARKIDNTFALRERTMSLFGGALPEGMREVPLQMQPTHLMPEYVKTLAERFDMNHVLAMALQDNHDESRAITGLIEVLSCNNVSTETVPAPTALNKKREARGKAPLFEYKVLMLDPQDVVGPRMNRGGTHASPRAHLRRGHIRRLPGRNVWVNAAIVGNRRNGVVVKDYAVTVSGAQLRPVKE